MKFLCFLLIITISAKSSKSTRLESYHRFHKIRPVNRIPNNRSDKPNTDNARKESTLKAREQAVRRDFCNAQTCLKCLKYIQFGIPSKQHLICKLTLALPQCCPTSIILYSGWQLLILKKYKNLIKDRSTLKVNISLVLNFQSCTLKWLKISCPFLP